MSDANFRQTPSSPIDYRRLHRRAGWLLAFSLACFVCGLGAVGGGICVLQRSLQNTGHSGQEIRSNELAGEIARVTPTITTCWYIGIPTASVGVIVCIPSAVLWFLTRPKRLAAVPANADIA